MVVGWWDIPLSLGSRLLLLLLLLLISLPKHQIIEATTQGEDDALLAVNNSLAVGGDSVKEAESLYQEAMKVLTPKHASYTALTQAIVHLERALELGHSLAPLELARLTFFGRSNFEPDYHRCVRYLEQCAEPECQFLLGVFHEYALGGRSRSMAHALAYYVVAAEHGNAGASLALAWQYSFGTVLTHSCVRARNYYFPVATEMAEKLREKRTTGSPKLTKLSYDKPDKGQQQSTQDVIDFYHYNADASDAASLLFLGQVYYLGIGGIERNVEEARRHFEEALSLGSNSAEGYLGLMDFYGEALPGGKPNYRRAYHRFRRAAKEKSATGLNGMGLLYWKGIEVVRDLDEAVKYFKQAAEQHHPEASYNLGKVLLEMDPSGNDDKIFGAFIEALRGGYVLAGYELAKMNMAEERTCGLARLLLQSMLEKHPSLSLHEEAVNLFKTGRGGPAFSRFLYVAAQGFDVARYNAAFVLERMARHERDPRPLRERALILWSLAADQGDVGAILKMGDYFYYGWGVPGGSPLPLTAAAYYHKAMERKSGQAAFNLAYLHQYGLGVTKDYHMAKKYYEQAVILAKEESQPEAWLPVALALRYLSLSRRLHGMRRRLRDLPRWSITLAATIIFGTTIVLFMTFNNNNNMFMGREHAPVQVVRAPPEGDDDQDRDRQPSLINAHDLGRPPTVVLSDQESEPDSAN